MKTACIFAHYDRDGIVDDYVLYYLKSLRACVDTLVFVTTAQINVDSASRVHSLGIEIVQRENEGYDFYSYKIGIGIVPIDQYDVLILCNDSVYGPFTDIAAILNKMNERTGDFWGVTESFDFAHHLQSYFLVFKRTILQSASFQGFWNSLEMLEDKKQIIRRYEVGLTQLLKTEGFEFYSLTSFEDLGTMRRIWKSRLDYWKSFTRRWRELQFWSDTLAVLRGSMDVGINHTHNEWKTLIQDHDVPFLKIELLRDNPRGVADLDTVLDVVKSRGDYPVELISAHQARAVMG